MMCQHGRGWRIDWARINSLPERLLSQMVAILPNEAAIIGRFGVLLLERTRLSELIPSHIGRIPHERNLDLMRC